MSKEHWFVARAPRWKSR